MLILTPGNFYIWDFWRKIRITPQISTCTRVFNNACLLYFNLEWKRTYSLKRCVKIIT